MASQWDGPARLPADFSGVVRLFPLPNLVLFPHVIQPLHIFEPRYCEMLLESLSSDRLVTMATLRPGWELNMGGLPPLSETVCIGQVISHAPTQEERHNILLIGLARAKIVEELDVQRPFRMATVELINDIYPTTGAAERMKLQQNLLEMYRRFIPDGTLAKESFQQMLSSQMSLGMLTDLIGFTMPIPMAVKEQLQGTANVDVRARVLLQCLGQMVDTRQENPTLEPWSFPPKFSMN